MGLTFEQRQKVKWAIDARARERLAFRLDSMGRQYNRQPKPRAHKIYRKAYL